MTVSTDVNLPYVHAAQFPDTCVVCNKHAPGSHVRLMTNSIGWWSWFLFLLGRFVVVKAPACRWCAWKLHALRFLSLVVVIIVSAIVIIWVGPMMNEFVPRHLRKYAQLLLVLICLSPYFLFQIYYAAPFDITAYTDSIDYEFSNSHYAFEFAILNKDADWIKINGNLLGPENFGSAYTLDDDSSDDSIEQEPE